MRSLWRTYGPAFRWVSTASESAYTCVSWGWHINDPEDYASALDPSGDEQGRRETRA